MILMILLIFITFLNIKLISQIIIPSQYNTIVFCIEFSVKFRDKRLILLPFSVEYFLMLAFHLTLIFSMTFLPTFYLVLITAIYRFHNANFMQQKKTQVDHWKCALIICELFLILFQLLIIVHKQIILNSKEYYQKEAMVDLIFLKISSSFFQSVLSNYQQ